MAKRKRSSKAVGVGVPVVSAAEDMRSELLREGLRKMRVEMLQLIQLLGRKPKRK